jgi:predicted membrane-bound spermidine synthase|tara:strand:+ start:595 stop:819 length:225 start_codon:yes stop_codon:yes gene_type:complete
MKALKLIKIPFRGYQIILAQEDSQVKEFSMTLQKTNEGSFDNTRIEQLNGNTGSDLIDMMEKMSLLIDASEHAK